MIQRDSLARSTLDTLPFNIAVLDEEGTILFTNQSWREFNGVGGDGSEMVGVNYFAGIDEDGDEYAREALLGIKSVLADEQDVFTLEYPCHTPETRQWFLMRTASLPEQDEGSVVVAHIDITKRKLAELDARQRRRELEHLMSRIEGLVGDVMEAVLHADSREEIEETVCTRLVGVDPYVCAWVGRVDLSSETIVPAASAGCGTPAADDQLSLDADDPTAAAVETGQVQVVRNAHTEDLGSIHRTPLSAAIDDADGSTADGDESSADADEPPADADEPSPRQAEVAAFPLTYNDTGYGVLTVYARGGDVLDEREIAVLEVLARVASTAINAIEGRRILTTDRVVELELALSNEGPFFRDIAAELACTLQYEGSIYQDDGSVTMLFVVRDADPEAVLAAARAHDDVTHVTHVSDSEDGSVFEFTVDEPPVVSQLARRGAETTAITAHEHDVRITLELPATADTRTVVEQLSETYPSTTLVARHERERPEQTKLELLAEIEEQLTGQQRLAIQKALLGGFFDWPRGVSGEELADSMDISPSTYHQHLRSAEKKVVSTLFGE